MADPIFANRRLAEVYDPLDTDRSDLELYVALVDELGARSILDIGCGTGTFACMLAKHGKEVTGVDPATASLDVAQRKPGADRVRWHTGNGVDLPPVTVDLVTMTGNVAQVFITDDEWSATLRAARSALRPEGWLVFETRDPAQEAWRGWNRAGSYRRVDLSEVGVLETWVDLIDVSLPLVSFRWTFAFEADGVVVTSDSTIRFRTEAELADSLTNAGFAVHEVRGAHDRPGLEFVVLAKPSI